MLSSPYWVVETNEDKERMECRIETKADKEKKKNE